MPLSFTLASNWSVRTVVTELTGESGHWQENQDSLKSRNNPPSRFVAHRLDRILRIEKFTKIEAAQRQLRTACRLFFQDGDCISVHTLAWAAHELLERHPNSSGSLLFNLADESPESAIAHAELTEARNFFKHYYNAPLKKIEFVENLNEWLLIDCGQMYRSITGRVLKEIYGVNAWVSIRQNKPFLHHPALLEYLRVQRLSKAQMLQLIDAHPDFRKLDFE